MPVLRRTALRALLPLFLSCLLPAAPAVAGPAADAPPFDSLARRVLACTACHGAQGRAGQDAYYPRIGGKPEGYLYNQLRNFRDGRRQYPQMTYLLDALPDAYLREIAHYFANEHPPYPPPQAADVSPATLARGRQLALQGDPARQLPACSACHGAALTGVAPAIPGLVGMPRDYLNAQLGAWKNNIRRASAPDCMAQIAARLSLDDISAAAAWLSSQPVPADARPATALPARLPLACGSVPGGAQ